MAEVRTLATYGAKHDVKTVVPAKIRAGLAALRKVHPQHHETYEEFSTRIGVGKATLAAFRKDFEEHIVEATIPGKAGSSRPIIYWFGDPKVAAKARGREIDHTTNA